MSAGSRLYAHAVSSVLRGDQARDESFGGQRFIDVDRFDVRTDNGFPEVLLTMHDGREVGAAVLPVGTYRPDGRDLAPADVHDSVEAAIRAAVAA